MIIQDIPHIFQPHYTSIYPPYSCGKNIEEIFYAYFVEQRHSIETDLVYLPVFWTSYYIMNNYGQNIEPIYNWLDQLDKTKQYFTIVQYDSGIFIKNKPPNLIVFSAGGGGLNYKSDCEKQETFYNLKRSIFHGNTADYTIPLSCLPVFPYLNYNRDIFCSFMGRFDTHKCRIDMHNLLKNNDKFTFYDSVGFEEYKNIINRSIFTLAPRGYGYTSFRMYEAILAESIPIYIWENKKVLPFEDILNWSEFCVVIHADDIENLPTILDACDINKMRSRLQEVKHLFLIANTFDYIVKKLI